jgi:hypothetical protein
LIETAKVTGVEPCRYLNHLFERLPEAITAEQVEALLPQNIQADAFRSR